MWHTTLQVYPKVHLNAESKFTATLTAENPQFTYVRHKPGHCVFR